MEKHKLMKGQINGKSKVDKIEDSGRPAVGSSDLADTPAAPARVTRILVKSDEAEEAGHRHGSNSSDAGQGSEPGTGRVSKEVRKAKLTEEQEEYLRSRDDTRSNMDAPVGELSDEHLALENFQRGHSAGYEEGKDDTKATYRELLSDYGLTPANIKLWQVVATFFIGLFAGLIVGIVI
jgi:hypothetical protein